MHRRTHSHGCLPRQAAGAVASTGKFPYYTGPCGFLYTLHNPQEGFSQGIDVCAVLWVPGEALMTITAPNTVMAVSPRCAEQSEWITLGKLRAFKIRQGGDEIARSTPKFSRGDRHLIAGLSFDLCASRRLFLSSLPEAKRRRLLNAENAMGSVPW